MQSFECAFVYHEVYKPKQTGELKSVFLPLLCRFRSVVLEYDLLLFDPELN